MTNVTYKNCGDECVADLDASGNPLRSYTWGQGIDDLLAITVYGETADNTGPAYAYTPAGRLASRAWARLDPVTGLPLQTLYAHDSFGQPLSVEYSDATPPVSFAYDALGRLTVAQSFLPATGEILFSTTNVYDGIELVAEIQNGVRVERPTDAFGRPAGIAVGGGYSVDYGYDAYGRFACVTSTVNGSVNNWQYGYLPGSGLLAAVEHPSLSTHKFYEPRRDLIAAVSNTWGAALVSTFDYSNDEAGRRTRRVDTTQGLSVTNAFGYNARSEVTEAVMGDDIYGYAYDQIGNREWGSVNAATNTYAANGLNQYSLITNHVNHVNPVQILPTYDLDGNMISDGNGWHYAWNGENRLIQASNALHLVTYAYDHQGRMIQKVVDGASRSFLWDGWNIIAEQLMHSGTNELMNYYVWGLDLSGSLQGAGGVGGLLTEVKDGTPYFAAFDANGNVTEFVNENGDVRAHYEYSPFGEITAQSGDMADAFTHRFSTKPFDVETGIVMYELRPYEPGLGRWLSRDPLEETGGLNLYGMLSNQPLENVDNLGLSMHFNIHAFFNKLLTAINKAKTAVREAKDCLRMLNHWRKGGDEQNTDDKYRHCLASCEINQSCGSAIARATGYMKEAFDLFRGYMQVSADYWLPVNIAVELDVLLQGGDFQDSVEDFTANEIGIKCAKSPDGCSKCCCDVYVP